jgi:heme A synthase
MDTIVVIHAGFANTVWLYLLILGIWSLWRAIRGQGVSGNFLGALVIGQIMIFIQAGLGALLYLNGYGEFLTEPAIHILYAAFSLVFLPFVFLYWLRGDDSNRAQWVLTFAVLFQFGTIFYRFGPYAPI